MANRSHQTHRSGPSFERSHPPKKSSPRYISPVAMKESEQEYYRSDSPSHSLTGSSFSSSSSSYLEISRSRSVERSGISTIFKAPLEHKYRAKKKKKKTRKTFFPFGNNSSSSSVNSDLAYGTGFIKVPKGQVRSQKSNETPESSKNNENYYGRRTLKEPISQVGSSSERSSYSGSDRRHIKEKSRQKRRITSHSSKKLLDDAAITAEIMAVGAGLAKLDKESSKINLINSQRKSPRHKGFASSSSYKPTRSETKYDSNDAAEWESAYDTESDSSVDSKLAYGSEPQKSWSLFGGKEKGKTTLTKNLHSDRKAHGTITRDVRDNALDQNLRQNSYKKHIKYSNKHPENEISGLSYGFDPIPKNPKKVDKIRGPVNSRSNPLISGNTQESTRLNSRELDPLIPARSKTVPFQIIQPQPITPVSQSIYEPEKQLKSKYLSSALEQVFFKNPSLYPDKDHDRLNNNMTKTATTSTIHRNDRSKNETLESTDKERYKKWNNTDFQPEIRRRETEIPQLQRKPLEIQRDLKQEESIGQKIDREIKIENNKPERERIIDKRRKREFEFYESPQGWQSTARLNRKRIRSDIKLEDYSVQNERENLLPLHDRPDKVQPTEIDPYFKSSKSGLSSSGPPVKDLTYNALGDYDDHNISKKPEINFNSKNQQPNRNEVHYGSDLVENLDKISISHKPTPVYPGKHLLDSSRGHENNPIEHGSNNLYIKSTSKKSSNSTFSIPTTGSRLTRSVAQDHEDSLSERWRNKNWRDNIESDCDYDPNRSRQGIISDKGNFRKKLDGNFQNTIRDHGTTLNIHPYSRSQTRSTAQESNDHVIGSDPTITFLPEKLNSEQRRNPSTFQNEPKSKFKFESGSNYPSDVTDHTISSVRLDQLDHKNLPNLNPQIDLHRNSLEFNSRQPFEPEPKVEEWGDLLAPRLAPEDQSQWTNLPSNNSRAFPKINPSTFPANSQIPKNVSWGENETKHFYDDVPFERQQGHISIPEKKAGSLSEKNFESVKYDTVEPSLLKVKPNSRDETLTNNIFRPGVSESFGNPGISSPMSRYRNNQMPQAPRYTFHSRDQKVNFPSTTEMNSKTSDLRDLHEEDIGFIATVAAGLQKTGFDPEMVDNLFGSRLKGNLPNLTESKNRNNVIHGESFPRNKSLPPEDLGSQNIYSDLPSHRDPSITLPHQKEFKKTMKNRQVTSKFASIKEPAGDQLDKVFYQFPEKSLDMKEKPKTNVNRNIFSKKKDDEIRPYETLEKDLTNTEKIRHDMIGEREQPPFLFNHFSPPDPSPMVQPSEKYMKIEDENVLKSPNQNVVSKNYFTFEKPQFSNISREKAEREGKKNDLEKFEDNSKSEMQFSKEKFLPSSYLAESKSFNHSEPASSSKIYDETNKDDIRFPSTKHFCFENPAIQNQHTNVVEADTIFIKESILDKKSKKPVHGKSNSNMIRTPKNLQAPYGKSNDSVNSSRTVPESLDENSTNNKEEEVFRHFGPANIQKRTPKIEISPFATMPYSSSKKNTQFFFGHDETQIPDKNSTLERTNKVEKKIQSVHYPHNEEDFKENNSTSQVMLKKSPLNTTVSKSKDLKLPSHFAFGRQTTEEPYEKDMVYSTVELAQTENLSSSNNLVSLQPHPERFKDMKDEYRHKKLNLVSKNEISLGKFPEEYITAPRDLKEPAHLITEIEITKEPSDKNFKKAIIELSETESSYSQQDNKGLIASHIRSRKNKNRNYDRIGKSMFDSVAPPDDLTKEKPTIRKGLEQPRLSSHAAEIQEGHSGEKAQFSLAEATHKILTSEIKKFQAPQRPMSKFDPKKLEYDIKIKNIDPKQGIISEKLPKENATIANNSLLHVDSVTGKKNFDKSFIKYSDQFLSKPSSFEVTTSSGNSRASQLSNVVSVPMSQEVNAYDKLPNSSKEKLVDESVTAKNNFTFPKFSSDKMEKNEWTRHKIPNTLLDKGTTPPSISNQEINKSSSTESTACGTESTDQISNSRPEMKITNENKNFSDRSLLKSTDGLDKNKSFSNSKIKKKSDRGQYELGHKTNGILETATNLPQINVMSSEDHNVGELVEKEKLNLIQGSNFQSDFIEEPFHKYLNVLEIGDAFTETIPNNEISDKLVLNPQISYLEEIKDAPRNSAALELTNDSKIKYFEESTNKSEDVLIDSTSKNVKDKYICKDDSIPKNNVQNFNHQFDIFKKQYSVKTIPNTKSTAATRINIPSFNEIQKNLVNKTKDENIFSFTENLKFQKDLNLKSEKMNRDNFTENNSPNLNKENYIENIRLTNIKPVQYKISNNQIETARKIDKGNLSDQCSDHIDIKSNHNKNILKKYAEKIYPVAEEKISLNEASNSIAKKHHTKESDAQPDTTRKISNMKLKHPLKDHMEEDTKSTETTIQEHFEREQPQVKKLMSKEIIPFTNFEVMRNKVSDVHIANKDYFDKENLRELDVRIKPIENISEEGSHSDQLIIVKGIITETIPFTKNETMQCTKTEDLQHVKSDICKKNFGEVHTDDVNVENELTRNLSEVSFEKTQPENKNEISTEIIPLNCDEEVHLTKSVAHFDATDNTVRKTQEELVISNFLLQDKSTEDTLEKDTDCKQFENNKEKFSMNISSRNNAVINFSEPGSHFNAGDNFEIKNSEDLDDNHTKEDTDSIKEKSDISYDERYLTDKKKLSLKNITVNDDNVVQPAKSIIKSNAAREIEKKSLDPIPIDHVNLPIVPEEKISKNKVDTEQPKNEREISMEISALSHDESVHRVKPGIHLNTNDSTDNVRIVEIDSDSINLQETTGDFASNEDAEIFSDIENRDDTESIPLGHNEPIPLAESTSQFYAGGQIYNERIDAITIEDVIAQNIDPEDVLEETAEPKQPENEGEISMEISALSHDESVHRVKPGIHLNTNDSTDKDSSEKIDSDRINFQETTGDFASKEGAERYSEIENEMETGTISLSHDESVQRKESRSHFDTVDKIDNESLGANSIDFLNFQDMALENVSEKVIETGNQKIEKEVDTELILLSYNESVQILDPRSNSDTEANIDKERIVEIDADNINSQETSRNFVSKESVESYSKIENEMETETIPLSHDESVQRMEKSTHLSTINEIENERNEEINLKVTTRDFVSKTGTEIYSEIEREVGTETILLDHSESVLRMEPSCHFDTDVNIYNESIEEIDNKVLNSQEMTGDISSKEGAESCFEIKKEIDTETIPLSNTGSVPLTELACQFDTGGDTHKERLDAIASGDVIVQDTVPEDVLEEAAEFKQPKNEREISMEISALSHDESVQHIDPITHLDKVDNFPNESVGEIAIDYVNLQDIAGENVSEKDVETEQIAIEPEVDTMTSSLSQDESVRSKDSRSHLNKIDNLDKESIEEIDADNINSQDTTGKLVSEEEFEKRYPAIEPEVDLETIPLSHDESVQRIELSAQLDTIDTTDNESNKVLNSQDMTEEIASKEIAESYSEIEKERDTEAIPLSNTESEPFTGLASRFDAGDKTCKESIDAIATNDVIVQETVPENVLEEAAEFKQPENEGEISMEISALSYDEAVQCMEPNIHLKLIDSTDNVRIVEIDNEQPNLQDMAGENLSEKDVEIEHQDIEKKVDTMISQLNQDESVQSMEASAHFSSIDNIDNECIEEMVPVSFNLQDMAEEITSRDSAEIYSEIEKEVDTESMPLGQNEFVPLVELAPQFDAGDDFDKERLGVIAVDVTVQDKVREILLEEVVENGHPAIGKEVDTEIIPLSHDEVSQCAEFADYFDATDFIESKIIGKHDLDDVNLQDTAEENSSEKGAESKQAKIEKEILIENIPLSHDEVVQCPESFDHFETVDYIDKETFGKTKTDDITVQELATEIASDEGDECRYVQLEKDDSLEITPSIIDEDVQCDDIGAFQVTKSDLNEENFDESNTCCVSIENSRTEEIAEKHAHDDHPEVDKENNIEISSLANDEAMQNAKLDTLQISTGDTNQENLGELDINHSKGAVQETICTKDLSEEYAKSRLFENEKEALFELNNIAKNIIYQSPKSIASLDIKGDTSEDNFGDLAIQEVKIDTDYLNQELEISHSSKSQNKENTANDKEVTEVSESKLMSNQDNLSMDIEDKVVQESIELIKDKPVRQNSSIIDDAVRLGRSDTSPVVVENISRENLEEFATQDRNMETSSVFKLSGPFQDSDSKSEEMSDHEKILNVQGAVENITSKVKENKEREFVDIEFSEINNDVSTETKILAKLDDVYHASPENSSGSIGEIVEEDLGEPVILVDSVESGSTLDKLEVSQFPELKTENHSDREKIEIDSIKVPQHSPLKAEYENKGGFYSDEVTENVKKVSIKLPPVTNNDGIQSETSNFEMKTSCDLPDDILGVSFSQATSEGINSSEVVEVAQYSNILSELKNEKKKADDEIIAHEIEQLSKPRIEKEIHPMCSDSCLSPPDLHGTTHTSDTNRKNQHNEKPIASENSSTRPSKVSLPLPAASSNSRKKKKSGKVVKFEKEKEPNLGAIVKSLTRQNENSDSIELPCVEVDSLDINFNENKKNIVADNNVSHSFFNEKSIGSGSTKPYPSDLGIASPIQQISGIEILPKRDKNLTPISSTSLPCIENSTISKESSLSNLAVTKTKKKKKKKL